MPYVTTISQKGQIVVPKEIRDKLKIKPADRLKVSADEKNITIERLSPLGEVVGMFKVDKPISKKDIKSAYATHASEKFK